MPDPRRERQGPPTPMKLNSAITAALSALLVAAAPAPEADAPAVALTRMSMSNW
jgi:hypothetical protein